MLYLCIVMCCSSVPHLINNKKFMTSFNKKLKDRPFEFKGGCYGVDGYPQLKVVRGELVFKVNVTKGYYKYYRRNTFEVVEKGDCFRYRVSNRVRQSLKRYLHDMYGKHLGLKSHEFSVSLSWV